MEKNSKMILKQIGKYKLWRNKYYVEFEPKYYCCYQALDENQIVDINNGWLGKRKKIVLINDDKDLSQKIKVIQEILNNLKMKNVTLFYIDLEYLFFKFAEKEKFAKKLEQIKNYVCSKESLLIVSNSYFLETRENSEFYEFIEEIKKNCYILGFNPQKCTSMELYLTDEEYLLI